MPALGAVGVGAREMPNRLRTRAHTVSGMATRPAGRYERNLYGLSSLAAAALLHAVLFCRTPKNKVEFCTAKPEATRKFKRIRLELLAAFAPKASNC